MTKQWLFLDALPRGFGDPSIEHFRSNPVESLVREIIQNSLDAALNPEVPVVVSLRTDLVDLGPDNPIVDLQAPFLACIERAASPLPQATKFFQDGLALIKNVGSPTRFLTVSDFNTKGLTGDPKAIQNSPWGALLNADGINQNSSEALGSFGIGHRAPFAFTKLRTIFYLTEIPGASKNSVETRFQGKTVLHSARKIGTAPELGEVYLSNLGRYVDLQGDSPLPLIDAEAPQWATKLRNLSRPAEVGPLGTSLLIPHPAIDTADVSEMAFWHEIRLAIFANFFYAIYSGKLIVILNGDESITRDSLSKSLQVFVNDKRTKSLTSQVRRQLDPAITVLNSLDKGTFRVTGLGEIDYFLRLNRAEMPLSTKTVSIARRSGMLITRAADRLKNLNDFDKAFDLFLCVKDSAGSALLREMEGPTHRELEITRLSDPQQKKTYRNFTDHVREWLTVHVNDPEADRAIARGLADLGSDNFNGLADSADNSNQGVTRGNFRVEIGELKRAKSRVKPSAGGDESTPAGGTKAKTKGKGGGKSPHGAKARPAGARQIEGVPFQASRVTNFRFIPKNDSPLVYAGKSFAKVQLILQASEKGQLAFFLYESGEQHKHALELLHVDRLDPKKLISSSSLQVQIQSSGRVLEEVWIPEAAVSSALELEAFCKKELD